MARFALIISAIAILASTSQAHVGITPPTGKPGQSLNASFHVPHGCNGSATTSITVSVPDTVVTILPAQVTNWNLTVAYRPLDKPMQVAGQTINQTVSNFTWAGGNLPNDQFQDFPMQITLPQVDLSNQSNVTLYFPTIQTCVNGSTAWDGIPTAPGYDKTKSKPSPQLIVTNAEPSAANDDHSSHGNSGNKPVNSGMNLSLGKFPLVATIAATTIGAIALL